RPPAGAAHSIPADRQAATAPSGPIIHGSGACTTTQTSAAASPIARPLAAGTMPPDALSSDAGDAPGRFENQPLRPGSPSAGPAGASFQPPPNALIRATLAVSRRPRMLIAVRSSLSAAA